MENMVIDTRSGVTVLRAFATIKTLNVTSLSGGAKRAKNLCVVITKTYVKLKKKILPKILKF